MSKRSTTYSFRRPPSDISASLEHLGAQLASIQEEVARARADLRLPSTLPRGTGDHTAAAEAATRAAAAEAEPDDGVSVEALHEIVETLLLDRPVTLQELVEATGVRQNRVSGALVWLGRAHGERLLRIPVAGAPGRRFRWFLVPETAV
jgi:hypothetical protein